MIGAADPRVAVTSQSSRRSANSSDAAGMSKIASADGLVEHRCYATSPSRCIVAVQPTSGAARTMDDEERLATDLAQVARLGVEGDENELRLLLARLVRRYRVKQPELAKRIAVTLEAPKSAAPGRRPVRSPVDRRAALASGEDAPALAILRVWEPPSKSDPPILAASLSARLERIIDERQRASELRRHGLEPIKSAIFVGPPGVGKTRSAKWISTRLQMPLYSLDLTAVMSSRLGQSGANLRYALDYAKDQPAILFLDEIDSIAKRRADQADVGELKRLVTIMLQELDEWPSSSLLLAATNHAELVDPALWRRFEAEVAFSMPSHDLVLTAVRHFLGPDAEAFSPYLSTLARVLDGKSYSDIERAILTMRRTWALDGGEASAAVACAVQGSIDSLPRGERIGIAVDLASGSDLSQHEIARMTSVSRDTIRKHARQSAGSSSND